MPNQQAQILKKMIPHLSREELSCLRNINLFNKKKHGLDIFFQELGPKIFANYKFSIKIDIIAMAPLTNNNIFSIVSSDEFVLHFFYPQKNSNVFLIFNVELARALLSQLLATSVFENFDGLELSVLEKGLLSFIAARSMLDLQKEFAGLVPHAKIMGVYNNKKDCQNIFDTENFGIATVSLTTPKKIFNSYIVIDSNLLNSHFLASNSRKMPIKPMEFIVRNLVIIIKIIKLSNTLFRSLEVFDLIFFSNKNIIKQNGNLFGECIFSFGDLIGAGEVFHSKDRYNLRFKKFPIIDGEAFMAEEVNESSPKHMRDTAAKFEVKLAIQLAQKTMTLQDVCLLSEGDILELDAKIDEPLKITMENKEIGSAELIEIENKLGLRITSINHYE